jgi:hypothetical protein
MKTPQSTTRPTDPDQQRRDLLDSQREANKPGARNFKDDALTDKVVSVEPDGTGPTSTETFDPDRDRQAGSGGPGADGDEERSDPSRVRR